jgi:hypothetical protein
MGRGRRRSWFVAAVAALLLAPPGTALAQQRISVAEFVRRLENARDLSLESVDAISPEKMDAIRGMVGLPLTVEYPGWIVAIPEDPLLEALDGDVPQDFQQAARRCAALLHDARRTLATRPVDDEELRGALERA